ncbi:hypothetical protein ACIRSJ_28510 [Streptomyces virginiae]|uniref:hypothetical protein n=1 Tax=Streptomyces TaxID=1883 RepID=UPI0004BDAFFD|nr:MULTISPECIES: hypothetical protein [Streptomyces]KJY17490.1 hypothetical protein VR43_29635 [Streptomyces sp. NRRL S-104]KOU28919.1 hypothetical protein ADK53_33710 [Streptomyces sp. WM6373]KOU58155.1 hypothetical protein ADK96_35225 [Streptomyces sp. IGB124]KOU70517.1 hypothetical protein ADK61_34075 [Streptomyces sp. XY66]KOU80526.1 hypothetical protein ADK93_32825 [Streptomyces sp. XY58]
MKLRIAAVAVAAVLTVPALSACDAISTAMDCANTAVAITDGANDLQQAVSQAGNSPQDAKNALDQIEANLKKIGDQTDNADLGKAIDSMNTAVKNVRTSIDSGNSVPDIKPVADAASEISKVCTPG